MSICVGINPAAGEYKSYNAGTDKISADRITPVRENDAKKISLMYDEIKAKLDGKPRFVCVVVGFWVSNEMRKNFIEIGNTKNFEEVQILHGCAIDFFIAMFKKWKNQEENDDIEFAEMEDFVYICEMDITQLTINGAVFKAMIMSKDPRFTKFDTPPMSECNYTVIQESNNEILLCEEYEPLPIRKIINCRKEKNQKFIKVKRDRKLFEVKIPAAETFIIEFNLDANGIYTFEFFNKEKPTFVDEIDPIKIKEALEKLPKFFNFPKSSYIYNPNVVGIDLGTTRCCVAVARPNKIETVSFDNSSRLLSSHVSYCETKPICGHVAASRMRNYSKTTVFDAKRIIGKKYNEVKLNKTWPFDVIDMENTPLIRIESKTGPLLVSAQQVSAELLKYIKLKAEEFQGKSLSHAVITVPAAFTYSQKRDTIKAALLAGWQKVDLLPEPVAATFAYFVNRHIPNNTTILLFDLGGGTLDTCIFKTVDNRLQVINGEGNLHIGGRDFDELLINHVIQILKDDFNITNLGNRKYNIMNECIKMKEFLSMTDEFLFDVDAYGQEGYITITRHQLEFLSKNLLKKIENFVNKVLKGAKMNHSDIQKVMLVGGGCRMPIVKKLLIGMFPKAEHWCQENVDEVVAIGAAYYSYHLLQTNSTSDCSIM